MCTFLSKLEKFIFQFLYFCHFLCIFVIFGSIELFPSCFRIRASDSKIFTSWNRIKRKFFLKLNNLYLNNLSYFCFWAYFDSFSSIFHSFQKNLMFLCSYSFPHFLIPHFLFPSFFFSFLICCHFGSPKMGPFFVSFRDSLLFWFSQDIYFFIKLFKKPPSDCHSAKN